jgi:uncharacterized protein YceK
MSQLKILFAVVVLVLLVGCSGIKTTLIHEPIYPVAGENITYTLMTSSSGGIENIRLFETISSINAAAVVTPGTEVLIKEWNPAGTPDSITVNHTKTGFSNNSYISYRFLVRNGDDKTRSHMVNFVTNPYPVSDHPAPAYVQGDVDRVFDIIFIPDQDITNMNTFYDNCREMIINSIFADPSIAFWNRQFNFYINPETGRATDYDDLIAGSDTLHEVPSNWVNCTFAEGKVLMHRQDLRDYASGGLYSTEQQNRGTILHESGHGLFDLADEYASGVHWQESDFPNNWSTLAGARADAPIRHKTADDARQMGTSGWYKICDENCNMKTTGAVATFYDEPCGDRVTYMVLDNALNP